MVVEYVSLDGVIQAPGHKTEDPAGGFAHGGWTQPYMADHRRYNNELYPTIGAFLLGRLTYQGFAAAWPSMKNEFADKLNSMPKYVVSSTLEKAEWNNSTVLRGDVVAEVSKLRQESSGDIVVHGSAQLVQTLLANDLIDELRLMVFPVVPRQRQAAFQ